MTAKKKVEKDKTVGNTYRTYCNTCNNKIKHTVLQSLTVTVDEKIYSDHYDEPPFEITWVDTYEFIECLSCEKVSFRHNHWFSEDDYYYSEEERASYYPEKQEELKKALELKHLPMNIKDIYMESINAFNTKSYILCAGGLRSIIEGIYKNQFQEESTELNLQKKIDSLADKGIITKNDIEVLHELRFMGNSALHELRKPKAEDISLAFEIIEHTLKSIYEFKHMGAQLKQTRNLNNQIQIT